MTEKQEAAQERGVPCFAELAGAAAKLLREAIERADPGDMKDIKQITGALKDLKELLEEEDALNSILYSITSVRTQNAGMASSNKTGTMVQVSFAVPNGYKNPKVVQFIEGMAVVMPSTVEDGVVTALLPIFATGSYAVADFEEAPPAGDGNEDDDDSANNGNDNENQEESPDTGASLALLPIVGLVVSGLAVSLSKKRSSK